MEFANTCQEMKDGGGGAPCTLPCHPRASSPPQKKMNKRTLTHRDPSLPIQKGCPKKPNLWHDAAWDGTFPFKVGLGSMQNARQNWLDILCIHFAFILLSSNNSKQLCEESRVGQTRRELQVSPLFTWLATEMGNDFERKGFKPELWEGF